MSLLTLSKAQKKLSKHIRQTRLSMGLTQSGLSKRSGVSLATLRKFEQKGIISLESYLKLLVVLNCLDALINTMKPEEPRFASIDDVLKNRTKKLPQKGWLS
ncbi:MAG: helix-turn-helix domain-containing protein [Proteobacteria bacterium]|nr:helix-turn-helix domain-containing protein [Pseudomonadota bacterium]